MIHLSILRKPKDGERIEMVWLPPPINQDGWVRNCYIGSKGVVKEGDKDGFILNMDTAGLIVNNRRPYIYRTFISPY